VEVRGERTKRGVGTEADGEAVKGSSIASLSRGTWVNYCLREHARSSGEGSGAPSPEAPLALLARSVRAAVMAGRALTCSSI
jgi:hypothetical protein